MTHESPQSPRLPPEIVRYLQGGPAESRQFDFLIGEWSVEATRFHDDGSVLMRYGATWTAQFLNGGRMVMDDFKACSPTGQPLSSYVTLRTYSETARRWEMAGLAALEAAAPAEWSGRRIGGEMLLDAMGKDREGTMVRTKIRFFDIGEQRFTWESRTSRDDGLTWHRNAMLTATRK